MPINFAKSDDAVQKPKRCNNQIEQKKKNKEQVTQESMPKLPWQENKIKILINF